MSFLLLQRDDAPNWIWVIVFIVFPLAARLLKWVLVKAGIAQPEGEAARRREDPRETLRKRREERRTAEAEGEDLWRRLARGELAETPPPSAAAAPARIPVPIPVSIEGPVREASLEEASEPAALSVLGEVSEPAEAAEVSLESEAEPLALEALSKAAPAMELVGARSAGFVLARGDLRRAMILSEILGPPVSDRPLRA